MRLGLALAAFVAACVPAVSEAATDEVCSSISLLSPAQGQHFIGTRPIHFSWSGEPMGTVSRELRLATLNGGETVLPLGGRFSDTVKVKMDGDMGWIIVFKDADGNVLCTSPAGLMKAGAGGGNASASGGSSLSTAVAGDTPPPAKAAVFMNNGRLVIVLQNSPYTGEYTKLVSSNDYDGRTEDLQGSIGLEIHGNDAVNKIYGSNLSDLIYSYDSPDFVNPGPGKDTVDLGKRTLNGTIFGSEGIATADGEADIVYAPSSTLIGGFSVSFNEATSFDGVLDQISGNGN